MKERIFVSVLICSIAANLLHSATFSESFLLAYRQDLRLARRDVVLTYLIRLNPAGQVTMQPQSVASEFRHTSAGFVLGRGWPGINIWTSGYGTQSRYITSRLMLNRTTFATVRSEDVSVKGAGLSFLSLTGKAEENFMLFRDRRNVSVIAARLSREGSTTGEVWGLSRPTERVSGPGVVSADGRIAAWVSWAGVIIQPLDERGRQLRKRSVLHPMRGWSIGDLAITNVLSGQKRYLLISGNNAHGSCYSFDRIALLVIDNQTVRRIYTAFDYLFQTAECGARPIEVDPRGRFLVYSDLVFRQGPLVLYYPLLYQALDANGRRSGTVKPIAENADLGFSLMTTR